MNTETIEKYVNGEIDDAAFNAEFEKLDAPAKVEAAKQLSEAKPKILSEISGLRKEREKVKEQKIEAEKPPEDFIAKFRGSQTKKAVDRIVKEKSLTEAEKAVLEANFAKMDEGGADADDIFENLKKVYAYSFADKLMEEARGGSAGAEGAAAFMSRQAGSAGASGGPSEIKENDLRVTRLLDEARKQGIPMTVEEAKRGLEASSKKWSGLKPLPAKA